jgi:hypothetical protein
MMAAASVVAQPAPRRGGRLPPEVGDLVGSSVTRIMALDEDGDGQLSKSEVTDLRLQPLFERADADKNQIVTKQELIDLFTREAASLKATDRPPAGPGGPPRPGQVLPPFVQDELRLTRSQRAELDKLQQDVDARLAKILTEDQLRRLAEMPPGRPGGPPPPPPPPPPRDGARPQE